MNLIILAAGPPKTDRNRHTQTSHGSSLLGKLINYLKGKNTVEKIVQTCNYLNYKPYVIVNKNNLELVDCLNKNKNKISKIIFPEDEKIHSTFKAALNIKGDCVMIAGDLIDLPANELQKFILTKYASASCLYKQKWGKTIFSIDKKLIRRTDVGDSVQKISEKHKHIFLSKENLSKAIEYFYKFYPNGNNSYGLDEYSYNDIGTFMSYSFYFEIWSDYKIDEISDKGLVSVNNIHSDND